MKIVVMSDTHLHQTTRSFETLCLRYCADADLVIHLGDWTRTAILDYLMQYPLAAVSGNMDDYAIHAKLPAKKTLRLNGRRIGITHGWGSEFDMHARLLKDLPDVDAIFYGHTHRPTNREEHGVLFFNPGSVTLGRGSYRGSIGIVHVEESIRAEVIPVKE